MVDEYVVQLIVREEIRRQRQLKDEGRFARTPDEMDKDEFLRVLVEEVGEVARAIHEGDGNNFLEEVIQIAAICESHLSGCVIVDVGDSSEIPF